jgi:hypothetical protein
MLKCKSQPRLYNSLKKHGVENHRFEIVCECIREHLSELEIYYIKFYNCFGTEHGLNLTSGGEVKKEVSKETKKKMSEAFKNRKPVSEETRKKLSELGKKRQQSKETREKISKANKGKVRSEEVKQKMSKAKKGKTTWNKGKKHSKETGQKIGIANKNRIWEEKSKLKISEAHKGKKNAAAKLTEVDVISIRNSNKKATELAEEFKIGINQIYNIKTRKTWKHLP